MSDMAADIDEDDHDAQVFMDTALPDQRLVCEGWFATHADSGRPGPHVHLRTNDSRDAVIRSDQTVELSEALSTVARRIERLWAHEGEAYAREVVLTSPDPDDPEVARRTRLRHLAFTQRVADHSDEVLVLLRRADSTDDALDSIAELLGVDPAEVLVELARFNLLMLTRPATRRRQNEMEAHEVDESG